MQVLVIIDFIFHNWEILLAVMVSPFQQIYSSFHHHHVAPISTDTTENKIQDTYISGTPRKSVSDLRGVLSREFLGQTRFCTHTYLPSENYVLTPIPREEHN